MIDCAVGWGLVYSGFLVNKQGGCGVGDKTHKMQRVLGFYGSTEATPAPSWRCYKQVNTFMIPLSYAHRWYFSLL